jgi:endonuclease-8
VPEGDTIRRLADKITDRFAGQTCTRCITRDPRLVGFDVTGRQLLGADAVGKHLFIRFDDGRTLHSHLRMTGSWVAGPASREPEWHRRVELWFDSGRLTGLDLPVVSIVRTDEESRVAGHLGPDVCAAEPPDLDEVVERMTAEPDTPLAGALLDQRNVAGFGNVYAVEVPFIAGVSPFQPVGAIAGLRELLEVGTAIIRANAQRGPQNTTGRRLRTDDHWVYGRRGRPCPICATPLDGADERSTPWRRVSVWCSSCQALLAEATVDLARVTKLIALHPAARSLPADWARFR